MQKVKSVIKRLFASVKAHPVRWLTAVVLVLLIASQLERFLHKGTVLGYQVRHSGTSVVGNSANQFTTNDNTACKKVSSKDVQTALGESVSQTGAGLHDRIQPTFLSICSYRTTNQPTRSVSIVIRDARDENAAKATFGAVAKRQGSETVNKLGDQAAFVTNSNQLMVRKGKRLVTVTVTKASGSDKASSKDVALKIAPKAL